MNIRVRQLVIAVLALTVWAGIVHALENVGSPELFDEEPAPSARAQQEHRECG